MNPFTYYDGTDVDPAGDYKLNDIGLVGMERFVAEIKRCGMRYTNAFIGNLVERS